MGVQDSLAFWNKLKQKIRVLIKQETGNCMRVNLCEVVSAPNGKTIGVKMPDGSTVMNIPYSEEVSDAVVGSLVLVVWFGTLTTAKAYYYNNGFAGSNVHHPASVESFVFSLGIVQDTTQTIWSFSEDQNGKEIAGKINANCKIIAKPYFILDNQSVYTSVLNQFYENRFYAAVTEPYANIRIIRGTENAISLTPDFRVEVLVLNLGG